MTSRINAATRRATISATVLISLATISGTAYAGEQFPPAPVPCPYISNIPTWGIAYNGAIQCFVGTDPRLGAATTEIITPVVPIIVRFLNSKGDVEDTSDPTGPLFANPKTSAFDVVANSPLFTPYNYKLGSTTLGETEWIEATERASFWNLPGATFKDWHLNLAFFPIPAVTIDVPDGDWATNGTHSFKVDAGFLNPKLQALRPDYGHGAMPVFLFYNVSEYAHGKPTNCCVEGYHQAVEYSPAQYEFFVYATYFDGSGTDADLEPLSHEIAEFAHDPFGNNPVPPWPSPFTFSLPWKPPYTFTKCQGNLEVGDPLEDRDASEEQFTITTAGMTYILQNVVTAAWQMHAEPSFSVNGWYTLKGAVDGEFAAPAPACPSR
ncbi:MAG: hypothetical protein WBE37_23290 [Bryobacteraceae bacterium]